MDIFEVETEQGALAQVIACCQRRADLTLGMAVCSEQGRGVAAGFLIGFHPAGSIGVRDGGTEPDRAETEGILPVQPAADTVSGDAGLARRRCGPGRPIAPDQRGIPAPVQPKHRHHDPGIGNCPVGFAQNIRAIKPVPAAKRLLLTYTAGADGSTDPHAFAKVMASAYLDSAKVAVAVAVQTSAIGGHPKASR